MRHFLYGGADMRFQGPGRREKFVSSLERRRSFGSSVDTISQSASVGEMKRTERDIIKMSFIRRHELSLFF